jgi:Fe2+ or Zn2+ uptake regulation protein
MAHSYDDRMPRLIGTSVEDVFQVLGRTTRPLTANEIHAILVKAHHEVTCTTVYRALQVLRRRGVVRAAATGSRAQRDARIAAILAQPGRAVADSSAMRFVISDDKRAEAVFATKLEKLTAALPKTTGQSLRRDFYRLVFRAPQPSGSKAAV